MPVRRSPRRQHPPDGWRYVFELSRDEKYIAQVQKASRDTAEFGFPTRPALFGSPKWWPLIERGDLPTDTLDGEISEVYWTSMADYPEFKLRTGDGTEHALTRSGDIRRYVVGLRAVVRRVQLEAKPGRATEFLGSMRNVVLSIMLQESPRRSPAVAPGPGGTGYKLEGGAGTHVHYFWLPSRADAERLATIGESAGAQARTWADVMGGAWTSVAVPGDVDPLPALKSEADGVRGKYDGYEVIPGDAENAIAFGPGDS